MMTEKSWVGCLLRLSRPETCLERTEFGTLYTRKESWLRSIKEFNYRTRRVTVWPETKLSRAYSERCELLLLLFIWLPDYLTTHQTNFIIRSIQFLNNNLVGILNFIDRTSSRSRSFSMQNQKGAVEYRKNSSKSDVCWSYMVYTYKWIDVDGGTKSVRTTASKRDEGIKVTEKPPNIWWFDRSNDFPSQRRYSLSHSHQWICWSDEADSDSRPDPEWGEQPERMKNYNSFYVKRCDGRRGKIKVQIPIVFFSVFFLSHFTSSPRSIQIFFFSLGYFSAQLRSLGTPKTYPITSVKWT